MEEQTRMVRLSRREAVKLASAGAAGALAAGPSAASVAAASPAAKLNGAQTKTPLWEIFEVALHGSAAGNPFREVLLRGVFRLGHRSVEVEGFYDGAGVYKLRFMPDSLGEWSYSTQSNLPALDKQQGSFQATAARERAHGPVRVENMFHFAHADGTPFLPFGTTCYAWVHQNDQLQEQTLKTLSGAPFNKLRMCVFPKSYEYNHNEPALYPFVRDASGKSDFTWPDPAFYAHIERRLLDLQALGIEADLILFHPYDRWGYASMAAGDDDAYLRYVLARFAAYRNVWWSMANEFDLMRDKTTADFDRLFHLVEQYDPYAHLRSIHYSRVMYDYARPWVTHASLQTYDFDAAPGYRKAWKKPIVYDEMQYEGNLNKRWGNVSGAEMVRRCWLGVINGCYVTHGETYLEGDASFNEDVTPTLWWSHGGTLHGSSPQRIAFLRKLVEDTMRVSGSRLGLEPSADPYYLNASVVAQGGQKILAVLYYFDFHQPIWYEFPLPEGRFKAEAVDPEAGTLTAVPGVFSGKSKLRLSGRPYQGMLFREMDSV